MENPRKESNSDDIEVEERSFRRMKYNMEKDGYREGIEEGRNKIFQKYFDEGYANGFKNGFTLGKLKGTIWAKSIVDQQDLMKVVELEKTSRGTCIICEDDKTLSLPISSLQSKQTQVLNNAIDNIVNKTGIKST